MKRKIFVGTTLLVATTVALAAPAMAQDGGTTADGVQAILDNIWVMIAGVLVFLMQAGFAMVEAGLTRAKNVSNIMAKNLSDFAVGVSAFFILGYAIAFGGGNDLFGTSGFFLSGLGDVSEMGGSGVGNLSVATFFFFQAVFAATAVTIASGAMAERTKFSSYLIFSVFMTGLVYPVVVHWTWGGGLIANISIGDAVYSDFAGSTVVHLTGACAALMGAIFLGPRIGKYDKDGKPRAILGHSSPLVIVGVIVLAFGWFGFNPGSELAADQYVGFVALNTILAAAAGTLAAGATSWIMSKKPDVGMAGNGTLAGLVAITAGCGTVDPWAALVIGLVGGIIVVLSVVGIDRMGIDDPVGAVSVHGMGGIWGTLAIGLFAKYDDAFLGRENAGLFYGGGISQLLMQLVMVVIVIAFVCAATGIFFAILKATLGIRVSAEEELAGLDVMEHGAPGYAPDSLAGLSIDEVSTSKTPVKV